MSIFYFLAAILLLSRISKSLVGFDQPIKWKRKLRLAAFGVSALYLIVQWTLNDVADTFVGSLLLLALLLYIKKESDFSGFNFYLWAHYPLVAVGLINGLTQLIAPEFYDTYDMYFGGSVLLAFAWVLARWINSKKQRDELALINMRNAQLDTLVAQRTIELTKQKEELQETIKLLQST